MSEERPSALWSINGVALKDAHNEFRGKVRGKGAEDMTGEERRKAQMGIGSWLSAALEDPAVCDEMKTDIRAWMDCEGSAMRWQPIETAPKDGTEVVLWVGTAVSGYPVHRAFYRRTHWRYWDGESHALENFERPTHWFRILPPEKEPTP